MPADASHCPACGARLTLENDTPWPLPQPTVPPAREPREGRPLGVRRGIGGLVGAILVALTLLVITPPNLQLTSRLDPSSLTGRLAWNTPFVVVVIAIGFLVGMWLGNRG